MSRLRTMHGTDLDIDVDGPLPDASHVPGVSRVDPTPEGIWVQLSGEPASLIHSLASVNVTGLRSREASLEEIFLGYYHSDAAGDGHRDGETGDGH